MDEELSIFNVDYNTMVQQQQELKFPKISKHVRNATVDKKKIKKPIQMNQKLKIEVENPYFQSLLTGRTRKSKASENSNYFNSSLTNFRNSSIGFTPKLKRLIKVAPTAEKIKNSPRSISVNLKSKTFSMKNMIDWKTSVLETLFISKQCEFNWEKDPSLFSAYQIKEIKEVDSGFVMKECLKNTVKKLSAELNQNHLMFNKLTDRQLLKACKWLFKLREETLKILRLIHEREGFLLRIVTESNESIDEIQDKFMKVTFEIISAITNWKVFNVSNKKFIYSGQNYLKKIHTDLNFLEKAYSNH